MAGMIHIYTGNGKGKTTAAYGVAVRAAGCERKSMIIQFMKDGFEYSESRALKKLNEYITIEKYGDDQFVLDKREPGTKDLELFQVGFKRSMELAESCEYPLLILDELSVASHFGLTTAAKVLPLLEKKHPALDLIITGRYCPGSWIEMADLVTEMREIKHYYSQGILSREGIDC